MEKEYFIDLDCYNIKKDRYMISNYGKIYSKINGQFLKTRIDDGYERVHLDTYNGYKLFRIHRLVLKMFKYHIKTSVSRDQVNHKDGNKRNNYYKNLEWANNMENIIHAINIGLKTFDSISGEKNHNSVLTEIDVHKICKLLEDDKNSYKTICNEIKKEYSNNLKVLIYHIKNRRNWKHISKNYNIPNVKKYKKQNRYLVKVQRLSKAEKYVIESW